MSRKVTAYFCEVVFLAVVFCRLIFPNLVQATGNQVCSIGPACVVGEFLYDDNYAPIATNATCNLTSRKSDGSMFLNKVAMSVGVSDGWYSYNVDTTGQTTGIYPTQICCTVTADIDVGTTEYLCMDKTFELTTSGISTTDVANAVWQSGSRTLTDFGSVSTDISSIKTTVNSIDSKVDALNTKIGTIGDNLNTILTKWGSYSAADILTNINIINNGLGNNTDTCTNNSVFGNIACVKDKWGSQTAQSLYDAANGALNVGTSLRAELNYNGKSTTAYQDVQSIKNYVSGLSTNVGQPGDLATDSTLFGKVKANKNDIANVSIGISNVQTTVNSISTKVDALDLKVTGIGTTVNSILAKWGNYSVNDILNNINGISVNIGNNGDSCSVNSVFGNIACVKDKWGSQTAQSLYDAANGALNVGTSLTAELGYHGRSTTAYADMQLIKGYVDTLETNIGDSNDPSSAATLFGKIKSNKEDIANVQTTVNSIANKISTLVYDIWNYTSRSLTGFGNLVASIWGNSNNNRTLTSGTLDSGELATKESVGSSLEAAVNSIKGADNKDLSQVSVGVSNVQTTINLLDTKINGISTTTNSILAKWGASSINDVLNQINGVDLNIGSNGDVCTDNTVFGNIACVKDKWGSQTAQGLYDAANGALTTVTALRSELNYNGKSKTAYGDMQSVISYVNSLESLVGKNGDVATDGTLFGKIKENTDNVAIVSGQVAGVQTTVDTIKSKVDSLDSKVDVVNGNVTILLNKWGNSSISDISTNVNNIKNILGTSSDTCSSNETIYGYIQCIRDKWGDQTANNLYNTANNATTIIASLRNELDYSGKSTTAYTDVQSLKTNVIALQTTIGSTNDTATAATVFGKIKKVQSVVDVLNGTGVQVDSVIDHWGSLSASDIFDKVKDLSSQIAAVNTVSNVSSILTLNQDNSNDLTALKNQVLSLKALINVNQTLLEKSVNTPIIKTWLEDGSVIFKTMITNPSSIKQSVPLKYYLPKEATKKDIMNVDSGVAVDYDASAESLYISGSFNLGPNETKIVSVEINDIWKISDTEIASLNKQATDLSKPLEKTSYFAQGVTLESNITAQLENISRIQKEAVTPEARIQAYRENIISLNQVKSEVKDLQSLVASLSSNSTMAGFVGGAQTVSLWGMILVIVISVVLVSIYMRVMILRAKKEGDKTIFQETRKVKNRIINKKNLKVAALWVVLFLGCGSSARLTWMGLDNYFAKCRAKTALTKTEEVKINQTIAQISPTIEPKVLGETTDQSKVIGKINIILPVESTSSVKLRSEPNMDADILGKIWSKQTVDEYEEKDNWTKIGINIKVDGINKYLIGWVKSQFIEK